MDDRKNKADAFLYGNVSAQRTHITRHVFKASLLFSIHDVASRFHYAKYLELCKSKNVEPKARPPMDWGKKKYVFFLLSKVRCIDIF
jgi:hypothetical protein